MGFSVKDEQGRGRVWNEQSWLDLEQGLQSPEWGEVRGGELGAIKTVSVFKWALTGKWPRLAVAEEPPVET